MRLGILWKSLLFSVSVALILYGLSGFLAQQGITAFGLLGDIWKMIALAIGLSVVVSVAYPHLRGIKSGDQMVAFLRREQNVGGAKQSFMDVVFATALEDGKAGQKIRVAVGNGIAAEGTITSYGGTFTPATLKITETERPG